MSFKPVPQDPDLTILLKESTIEGLKNFSYFIDNDNKLSYDKLIRLLLSEYYKAHGFNAREDIRA